MEFDNTNSGALFKNDKKGNESWPDYTGSLNAGGVEYWLSAWIKKSKKGQTFMSLSLQEKDRETAETPEPDDDIPF